MATIAADGTVLDVWFPAPELSEPGSETGTVRLSVAEVPDELAALAGRDEDRDVETVVVRTDSGPARTVRIDGLGPSASAHVRDELTPAV